MKGRNPSATEKRYHDLLATSIGCIACWKERGERNCFVSIHHVDGRTKPDAHWLVLPLCAGHHQDNGTAIAVHPWKARFELAYGPQRHLIAECAIQLADAGHELPRRIAEIIGLEIAA